MKYYHKSIFVLLLAIITLSACDLGEFFPNTTQPESITQRLQSFEDALNTTDRSQLYTYFHPVDTANYNQIKDASFFDEDSPLSLVNRPFSIAQDNTVDGLEGRKIVTGSLTHLYNTFTVRFIMLMSDQQWCIEELILLTDNTEIWAVRQITG